MASEARRGPSWGLKSLFPAGGRASPGASSALSRVREEGGCSDPPSPGPSSVPALFWSFK
jgi:hypothetical protein